MTQEQILSVLGIGLGPANLALATAIEEIVNKNQMFDCLFLEKRSSFTWYPDMMLPGSKLQVPFLRDLATLRDPCSRFTFINYLKSQQRLDAFINLRTFYPTREEFYDYLKWVSRQLSHFIKYHCKVETILPHWDSKKQTINALKIIYRNEDTEMLHSVLTQHLVLGVGREPFRPECARCNDPRIIHTHHFLTQLQQQFPDTQKKYSFVIVGSGQSAGEIVLYLLKHYPNSKIHLCFRNYTLRGIDSNPFINRTYHQSAINDFYAMGQTAKQQALEELKNSNYGVLDHDILAELINYDYTARLKNIDNFVIHSGMNLKMISLFESKINAVFDRVFYNDCKTLTVDGMILATGYSSTQSWDLLKEIESYLIKEPSGDYQIDENYRLLCSPKFLPHLYIQGNCEYSHGPSDNTLATLATRAELITNSLLETIQTQRQLYPQSIKG